MDLRLGTILFCDLLQFKTSAGAKRYGILARKQAKGVITMFLKGLKVLDIGSYIAGPAAATVMADFGADVIKVEPLDGDPYRTLLGLVVLEYPNFFWDQDSRSKRSLSIDLSVPAGHEVIEKLITWSDVVVTNYRPELLERLKLNYEDVCAIRADVIYGQVNSYGLEGADTNRTGFDATAWWARSGLMDFVRRPQAPPAVSAPGMGDHPTCMSLFGGIMGALYRRERTGQGAHVHTSLMANGAWAHSMMIQGALVGFDVSDQRTPDDIKRAPLATMYVTSDDRVLLLSILNPVKEWPKLLRAIDRTEWADDPRFSERTERMMHGPELYDLMVDVFGSDTAANWRARLDAQQITYSFAHSLSEVVNDEQMYENDVLTPMAEGKQLYAHTVNSPIWISGEEKRMPVAAPDIGEHTVEILTELGLSSSDIETMLKDDTARQAGEE
ncbi:MAG: CoA transferase [Pseudomonadales bacterium]|nr:CoA transferase [Pseudomonadales bacterium]MDP7597897.1 CoA transferase [Pseudomonadales bacterium]HJN51950.1 CoA transferase [Pseudomonadales bacterium]